MGAIPAQLTGVVDDLAIRASGGDQAAFGELYEQLADKLLRYVALRTGGNIAVAEDVAAGTWEVVARKIRGWQPKGGGFVPWLYAVARNEANSHFRRTARNRERLEGDMLTYDTALDASAEPDVIYAAQLRRQQVAAALRALPARQRECIHLRFFVGATLEETASIMGRNPNAIKQLQHRALGRLRKMLGQIEYDQLTVDTYVPRADFDAATRSSGPRSAVDPEEARP